MVVAVPVCVMLCDAVKDAEVVSVRLCDADDDADNVWDVVWDGVLLNDAEVLTVGVLDADAVDDIDCDSVPEMLGDTLVDEVMEADAEVVDEVDIETVALPLAVPESVGDLELDALLEALRVLDVVRDGDNVAVWDRVDVCDNDRESVSDSDVVVDAVRLLLMLDECDGLWDWE